MGKFCIPVNCLLGLLCAAVAAFPALAAVEQIGYDRSTTSYYVKPGSIGTGPGVSVVRESGALQVEHMTGGGLRQRMPAGVIIEAKQVKAPLSAYFRATPGALKNAAVRCFTSARCNFALMAGSAGIDALFDGLDWVMGEGGQIQAFKDKLEYPESLPNGDTTNYQDRYTTSQQYGRVNTCAPTSSDLIVVTCRRPVNEYDFNQGYRTWYECQKVYRSNPLTGWASSSGSATCYYGSTVSEPIENLRRNVTESELQSGFESYNPDPSDWPFVSAGIDPSVDDVSLEISAPDPIYLPPTTFDIFGPDGQLVGTGARTSGIDFGVSGSPGPRPDLSVTETTTEETFDETGNPTGGSSESTTISPLPGGVVGLPPSDVPTDCDFMPTVCRFLEWFREPDPEINGEVDFSQLIDTIEIERDFSVGSSTAACPAPLVVNLSWVPSVEVSLQPFCDFADLLRPVLLAISSIFSGMIILRT